jgi:hypothetical protein
MKQPGGGASERLPTSAQLLASMVQASKAFTQLMKLLRQHDNNHLVFHATVRLGGRYVDQFLKARPPYA